MITVKQVILMLVFLSTTRKLYQYYYSKKYDKRVKTKCIWLSEYTLEYSIEHNNTVCM